MNLLLLTLVALVAIEFLYLLNLRSEHKALQQAYKALLEQDVVNHQTIKRLQRISGVTKHQPETNAWKEAQEFNRKKQQQVYGHQRKHRDSGMYGYNDDFLMTGSRHADDYETRSCSTNSTSSYNSASSYDSGSSDSSSSSSSCD